MMMLESWNSKRGNGEITQRLVTARSSYHYHSWGNNKGRDDFTRTKGLSFCWFIWRQPAEYEWEYILRMYFERIQNVTLDGAGTVDTLLRASGFNMWNCSNNLFALLTEIWA